FAVGGDAIGLESQRISGGEHPLHFFGERRIRAAVACHQRVSRFVQYFLPEHRSEVEAAVGHTLLRPLKQSLLFGVSLESGSARELLFGQVLHRVRGVVGVLDFLFSLGGGSSRGGNGSCYRRPEGFDAELSPGWPSRTDKEHHGNHQDDAATSEFPRDELPHRNRSFLIAAPVQSTSPAPVRSTKWRRRPKSDT